jgi:hypothetical protein
MHADRGMRSIICENKRGLAIRGGLSRGDINGQSRHTGSTERPGEIESRAREMGTAN